jgi:hypothetical protein
MWPCVYSLHKSRDNLVDLQVYNIVVGSIFCYPQQSAGVQQASIVLLPHQPSNSIVAVCGASLLTWNANTLEAPPKEVALSDAKLGRVILNANAKLCAVIPETFNVIIGAADTVQVWDIASARLLLQATPDTSQPNSYMLIEAYRDTLVTVSRLNVYIYTYDLAAFSEPSPVIIQHTESTLTTAAALDDAFLVLGNNHGSVALHRRASGSLIYVVNTVTPLAVAPSAASALIPMAMAQRCQVIRRLGRYIVCGFEHSYAAIYDMHVEGGAPLVEYRHPTDGSVQTVEIESGIILLGIMPRQKEAALAGAAPKRKPEIIVWAPKVTGFEFFFEAAGQAGSSFTSLHYSYTRIAQMLSDFAVANPKEDVDEFQTTIERVPMTISDLVQLKRAAAELDVPFSVIAELQTALDHYDSSLAKLVRSGKLQRIVRNTRLRREIEKWNAKLAQSLQRVDQEVRKLQRQSGVMLRRGTTIRALKGSFRLNNSDGAAQQQQQQQQQQQAGGAAAAAAAPTQSPAAPTQQATAAQAVAAAEGLQLQLQQQRESAARRDTELRAREAQLREQAEMLAQFEAVRKIEEERVIAEQRALSQRAARISAGTGSPAPASPVLTNLRPGQARTSLNASGAAGGDMRGSPMRQRVSTTSSSSTASPTASATSYSSISATGAAAAAAAASTSGDSVQSTRYHSYEDIPIYDSFGHISNELAQEMQSRHGSAEVSALLDDDQVENGAGAGAMTTTDDDEDFGIIVDAQGRLFWKEICGLRATMLDWDTFFAALCQRCRDPIDSKVLQNILDNSRTGFVSQYKFNEFLKAFGPLERCLRNVNELLSQTWFHGFLTSKESEMLLDPAPKGTFLLRFSKSTTGSFALAFKSRDGSGPQTMSHIVITSALPAGFKIREGNSTYKLFDSLVAIIKHYSFVLKIAFASRITEQPWFQGDLNSSETEELLLGGAPGTYLVRFSSVRPGALALSFVLPNRTVRHARICNTTGAESRFFIENEQHRATFISVQALIEHYVRSGVLTQPYQ